MKQISCKYCSELFQGTKSRKFCSIKCSHSHRSTKLSIERNCLHCNKTIITTEKRNKKYCSTYCSKKRIKSENELSKISKTSAEKFIKNPKLREVSSKNGKKAMQYLMENNLRWQMPPGYHTDKHKQYMKELMTGRNVTWSDKIKKNHWTTNDKIKNDTIDKILKTRSKNKFWNSEERRYQLANWSLDNPDKVGPKMYKRGIHKNLKTGENEYYRSGFELEYMKKFDTDNSIKTYTSKHGIRIKYEYDGKYRIYIPDILVEYINGDKKLIELKGRIYNKDIIDSKINSAKTYCRNNDIKFEIIYQK